jgi:hypothetical protein
MRPICQACNQRAKAIAYHRPDGQIQYRRLCEYCIKRKKRIPVPVARWKSSGYKKKTTCDNCFFKAKYSAQLLVYYIDGNLNNSALRNLKTICLNCTVEISKLDLIWRASDLEPDR